MNLNLSIAAMSLIFSASAYSSEHRFSGVVHPKETDPAAQGSCEAVITTDDTGVAVVASGRIHDPKKNRTLSLRFERGGGSTHVWDIDYDRKTAQLKRIHAESYPTDHLLGGLPDVLEIKDLHKGAIKLTLKRTVSYEGLWVARQTLKCAGMTPVKPF